MARWAGRQERGSAALIRLMIWLSLRLGWPIGQALLYPITLYFVIVSRGARAASRGFLRRVLDRPATIADVFRHIFAFSCVLLDRLFLLSNRTGRFRIDVVGLDNVTSALAQSRGCILLGSHLGSFEALRVIARQSPTPVKVLMYRANTGPYSRLVEALDPKLADSIIEIGTPEAMLRVRESIDRGEMVGILADRAPRNDKMVEAPFLGDPALFPTGPLILSAALGAPVVLFFGIRTGPRRYVIYFEPFADRIVLDRRRRTEDIAAWAERYATKLEAYCRRFPFNWFNFYDFWDARDQADEPTPPAGTVDRERIVGLGRSRGVPVTSGADRWVDATPIPHTRAP